MAEDDYDDLLYIDVKDDLRRVDDVMTRVLKDRATWSEFIRDPNGVFIRLGLHPPTTARNNDRANRIFYATLTNSDLLALLVKHYDRFQPTNEEKFRSVSLEAAGEGRVAHDIELDLEAFAHYLNHPDVMREALRLSLHDLNRRGILERRYDDDEIGDFIKRYLEVAERRPEIAAFPTLEEWDRNYGIGFTFGGKSFAELGIGVTVGAAVEVVVGGTNAAIVYQVVGFWGPSTEVSAAQVATGDEQTVRGAAIFGRLMDFTGELLEYVHRFERSRQ